MDQVCENGVGQDELLQAVNDAHGGVIVDMKEPLSPEIFHARLKASLFIWKQQGKRGVWIKLPNELVNLAESAVKEGFWFHHAEPNYLMLVYWIPITCSTIPSNATHRVSVGAILLNEKREMLVVQEKSGRFRGSGVWKIPTGVVDEGEELFAAAIREVKEETGVDAEFLEVLAFRQLHKTFFGKSDLFFLCMMHPLSFDIQTQELEIEAAQWMPLEEYAAQPIAQKHEPFKYVTDMCLAKLNSDYTGFSKRPISSLFQDQISCVYLNATDLDQVVCHVAVNPEILKQKDENIQNHQHEASDYKQKALLRKMAARYFSFLAVWLFIFSACDYTEEARVVIHDDPVTVPGACQDPCQNLPPPPPPPGGEGYPIYGAPPPPRPPPPPPPPSAIPGAGQVNCSQYPTQCCNNNNNNNNPPPFTYVPVSYAYKSFTKPFVCTALILVSLFVALLF